MPDKHEVGGSSPLGPTSPESGQPNIGILTTKVSGIPRWVAFQKESNENRRSNYKPKQFGGVAQLGEHLPCKQGVMGSNPIISTNPESG